MKIWLLQGNLSKSLAIRLHANASEVVTVESTLWNRIGYGHFTLRVRVSRRKPVVMLLLVVCKAEMIDSTTSRWAQKSGIC